MTIAIKISQWKQSQVEMKKSPCDNKEDVMMSDSLPHLSSSSAELRQPSSVISDNNSDRGVGVGQISESRRYGATRRKWESSSSSSTRITTNITNVNNNKYKRSSNNISKNSGGDGSSYKMRTFNSVHGGGGGSGCSARVITMKRLWNHLGFTFYVSFLAFGRLSFSQPTGTVIDTNETLLTAASSVESASTSDLSRVSVQKKEKKRKCN